MNGNVGLIMKLVNWRSYALIRSPSDIVSD
jgi:hypothetical protein